MNIGENIKRFRKEKGLTQRELGERLNMSQSAIGQFENNTTSPKLETVEKIASALETTPFKLMGSEYFDLKYPEIEQQANEETKFIDYLQSLGYIVKDIVTPSQIPVEEFEKASRMDLLTEEEIKVGYVPAESHSYELIKDGKGIILEDDEFSELLKFTKDVIALKFLQKFQEKK